LEPEEIGALEDAAWRLERRRARRAAEQDGKQQ